MLTEFIRHVRALVLLVFRRPPRSSAAAGLFRRLVASECLLIEAYAHTEHGARGVPDCDTTGGSFDLGPILYFLNHPPWILRWPVRRLVALLERVEDAELPPSRIDPVEWVAIVELARTTGIVAQDGTIYGEAKYEQLDLRWLIAVVEFVTHLDDKAPFGGPIAPIEHPGDGEITIAIVGDWGTGPVGAGGGPAQNVIDDINGLSPRPDYVVHLGDVYYAGTPTEERHNLRKLWPSDLNGRSFTLNSNHEMYNGAKGYFEVALDEDGPFSLQTGPKVGARPVKQTASSFFALKFGDWVVLGLDSGYNATAESMYMDGRLGATQIEWVQQHYGERGGKNVIVMTHHDGLETDGSGPKELWGDMMTAVCGDGPEYWYWGHVHNGIAYDPRPAAGGAAGGHLVNARCVGHGAIPYGRAWGLLGDDDEPIDGIAYVAHTPVPDDPPKVYNGFMTITLAAGGTLTEQWWESRGAGAPVRVLPEPGGG